jgi:hypothetical protein
MRFTLAAMLVLGACKGDPQKCDTGCRNYATLLYWQKADAEIAAAPAAERDVLRRRKLGMFNSKLENGVDLCVSQCQSANNTKDIDCLIAAKTADQALACLK